MLDLTEFWLPSPHLPSAYSPVPCVAIFVQHVQPSRGIGEKRVVALRYPDGGSQEKGYSLLLVILKDDWVLTNLEPGDSFNILMEQSTRPELTPPATSHPLVIEITAMSNYIILHPHTIVPVTSVVSALECQRRPVISSLIQRSAGCSAELAWGNIVHQTLQQCVLEHAKNEDEIRETLDHVLSSYQDVIDSLKTTTELAKTKCLERMGDLAEFGALFIPNWGIELDTAHPGSRLRDLNARQSIEETEEAIQSSIFGLKGFVDMSMKVTRSTESGMEEARRVPVEIKTGRPANRVSHRAQLMLYVLLMAEKYDTEVSTGLLYYTQDNSVRYIRPSRPEIRGLIITRNDVAHNLILAARINERPSRPDQEPNEVSVLSQVRNTAVNGTPGIDTRAICRQCNAIDACMLYRMTACSDPNEVAKDIEDLFTDRTRHLKANHVSFFSHWDHLLTLEARHTIRAGREFWNTRSGTQEVTETKLSNMTLDPLDPPDLAQANDDGTYCYTFRRSKATTRKYSPIRLMESSITQGDQVIVAVEPHWTALARGIVLTMTRTSVQVATTRRLTLTKTAKLYAERNGFVISRNDASTALLRLRSNVAHLFFADGDQKRRELIVDLRAPVFVPTALAVHPDAPEINNQQTLAVEMVLSAQDYALMLGMPGTGKSMTIIYIIHELVRRNKSVLLTSYTHSAVDNIITMLAGAPFDVIRLKGTAKAPEHSSSPGQSRKGHNYAFASTSQIQTAPVVATTALSADHHLLKKRTFDYCIVDEATQMTIPACLGPLRLADTFILVGDHFQLPPVVRSHEAKKRGMDVSLFQTLLNAHPEASVALEYQYRMNKDIMDVSNRLTYDGRLRCDSTEVLNRSLRIPNITASHANLGGCADKVCWLKSILDEKFGVLYIDTDDIPGTETQTGEGVLNETEAHLTRQIVTALISTGVDQSDIGIISPYNHQVRYIRLLLEAPRYEHVEILTVDKAQGKQKECVIVSLVRSNPDETESKTLLHDFRRINVSLTRARSKLIVMGSGNTLKRVPTVSDLLEIAQENGWYIRLPPKSADIHYLTYDDADQGKHTLEACSIDLGKDSCQRKRPRPLVTRQHPDISSENVS